MVMIAITIVPKMMRNASITSLDYMGNVTKKLRVKGKTLVLHGFGEVGYGKCNHLGCNKGFQGRYGFNARNALWRGKTHNYVFSFFIMKDMC